MSPETRHNRRTRPQRELFQSYPPSEPWDSAHVGIRPANLAPCPALGDFCIPPPLLFADLFGLHVVVTQKAVVDAAVTKANKKSSGGTEEQSQNSIHGH